MAKKELYIHIGMPKTSTSTLQRFFTLNRQILKEKGISYPSGENTEAHHRLGWSLKTERGLSHWWFHEDVGSFDQEWQAKALNKLKKHAKTLEENLESEKNKLNKLYSSRTWKAGMVLNRIYNKMPGWLQKFALSSGTWIYHRIKK